MIIMGFLETAQAKVKEIYAATEENHNRGLCIWRLSALDISAIHWANISCWSIQAGKGLGSNVTQAND